MTGSLHTLALAPGWHLGGLYTLALLAAGITIVTATTAMSRRKDWAFSASVLYVGLGGVIAIALAVLGVPPLDPEHDHTLVERLTELALVVAVFSAGLTIERHVSRRSWISIALLLVVVMPLTILAIAAFGVWAMGLSSGGALLLGAVLAPTDPVLAGDVGLSGVGGEVYGEPRLSLHTEAGFNDGLASPFVAFGLYAADPGGTGWIGSWLTADLLYATGASLLIGALAGAGAAAALTRSRTRGIIPSDVEGFATLGIVLVIYAVDEAIGGYGLLAVFAAGFTFRRYEFDHEIHRPVHHAAEVAGHTLELLVLLLLGTMLTTGGLGTPGLAGWLLVPLLLVVIRPVLVAATAGREFLDRRSVLFLGFFGVRGVAALFYAAVVAGAGVLSPAEQRTVIWTTIVCVVASIVVHGVTAQPLTRRWLGGP
jgi:NhaP-type Na+/H+ or K+/H+ antiporter